MVKLFENFFRGTNPLKTNRSRRRRRGLSIELLEKREMLTVLTPGNLIILRSGNGSAFNGTAPLFLDEYSTSGTLIRTISIPYDQIVGGPGNQPITIDLSAAAGNGQLNRSYDGSVLTFGGVDSGINSTAATGSADRVIAITGNDPTANNFLDTTTHGQFYVGDDNRGAVAESANGPIWAVGHPNQAGGAVSQGVHYFPNPGPSLGTQVSAGANIRGATIGFDNRLYFSTAGSNQTGLAGIYTEAQALPTLATPASDVPVVSALFSASKLGGIYLADVNGTGILQNGDRLYFIDDGTVGGAGTGGLYVSTYNSAYPGNHWSTAVRLGEGIIDSQPNPQPTAQLRGLAGTIVSPTETDLYVTEFDNVAGNNSYILKFTDTGTGVNIASANESGNMVTITTAVPHNFTSGQRVVVDGINTGMGGTTIVTDGYNGSWIINVVNSTTFTYTDTNPNGTGLATITGQGAADVAVSPTTVATLADGSVTIGGGTFAARGIRGVAYAPVSPTLVSLTVDGSSSTKVPPGTAVTFVATLDNAQVNPTGSVTFIDQNTNTVLGRAPITTMKGVTSATFKATLVGNHVVTAYFAGGGTGELTSATSGPVTVIEAGSTNSVTSLSASLSAAALGLPVLLTASVSPGGGRPAGATPTGTVSFYNGGTNLSNLLGSATVDGSGMATFTTTFSSIGKQNITAIYNGDDTYASSSDTTTVTTDANATAVITSSANNVPVGSTTTYTATIVGNTTLGTPAGLAQFYQDGAAFGPNVPIATASETGTTVTITTSAAHGLSTGQLVTIAGVTISISTANLYNGAFTITVTGTNTFTYSLPVSGLAAGTGGAVFVPLTLIPGGNNTATASLTSPALTAGSHLVTVSYYTTGKGNPYLNFAVNTITATNGVALIETALQAFTPGNLVAVQRGDGSVNLGSSGYLVFLDEYTTGGTLVQKIALPNLDGDTSHALLLSGQNGAEGLLNRSADGYYLTVMGYDVPVGQQFVTSTFPFQFPRTIARINRAGNLDTSTAISTTPKSSVPYNPLDVVSNDGNEFWLVSNLPTGNTTESGIEYVDSLGASSATQIGEPGTSGDSITIAGGQLYAASGNQRAGSAVGVWQIGTGLPTTMTSLATLPGLQAAYQAAFPNEQNAKQLLFFNHLDGTSNNPDTLYIADQSNGLLKFWFDGTNWRYGNASGLFGQKLVFAGGATGVIGRVVNPGPNAQFQLYVTGSNLQGQNPNQIASFLDTNAYNNGFAPGNFNTVVFVGETAGSFNGNENFAGLAFVPGYQTTTMLTSSSNPATEGHPVTFTATVTAAAGTPTGVVTFYDGNTVLGSGTLNGSGVATLMISTLTVGDHQITAFYNSDVNDGVSRSDVLTQTIVSGGGHPGPGFRGPIPFHSELTPSGATTIGSTLRSLVSQARVVPESNHGVSSQPTMITTDNGPIESTIGNAAHITDATVDGTQSDAFWRLLGSESRRADSLEIVDLEEAGYIVG